MAPPKGKGLLQVVATWFHVVAKSFKVVKPRLTIEACVGDVTAVLEQIRYGAIARGVPTAAPADVNMASPGQNVNDIEYYPHAYGRIHRSNVPDYFGGTLSTFLNAVPVIHPDKTSYVTADCLRNLPRFKSHAHFNNEYIAISDTNTLDKVFHVSMAKFPDPTAPPNLTEYAEWHQEFVSQTFSNLLHRFQLETWLFRLFLKLAIPKERELRSQIRIYSPLNLKIFLRLCDHLHNIGYPAHWLSGILDELVSGKIRPGARPPRSDPLTMAEVKANFPVVEQSTAPFVAEMTTLLSLWRFFLPFGVLPHHIRDVQLVHQYEVPFPGMEGFIAESPYFIIVLFSMRLLPQEAENTMRTFLLSDEKGADGAEARKAREEGLHVISTWKWDRVAKKAVFWFRRDTYEALDRKEWGISICGTDVWVRQAGLEMLDRVRDLGPCLEAAS